MRVNQPGNSSIQNAQTANASKAEKAARPDRSATNDIRGREAPIPGSVKTEISGRAREAAQAKEVAMSAGDIREQKIAELKKRIAEGTYKVDTKAVADRMVDDHLSTGIG